jgi:hypothetical protein
MLGFLLFYELFLYLVGRFTNDGTWTLYVRVTVGFTYILGWLIGRLVLQQPMSGPLDLHHVIRKYMNKRN